MLTGLWETVYYTFYSRPQPETICRYSPESWQETCDALIEVDPRILGTAALMTAGIVGSGIYWLLKSPASPKKPLVIKEEKNETRDSPDDLIRAVSDHPLLIEEGEMGKGTAYPVQTIINTFFQKFPDMNRKEKYLNPPGINQAEREKNRKMAKVAILRELGLPENGEMPAETQVLVAALEKVGLDSSAYRP